mgnify:CR=1 FL=1
MVDALDEKVFDLVEGGEKINLFTNQTEKPISEMDITELSNAAALLSNNPGGRPQAPRDLRGKDRVNWHKENFVHPLTGQTFGDYIEDSGLDIRTAFNEFDDITKNLKHDLKDEIRIKTGTKLNLLKVAINDENIGNFLGVTDEMKNNQHLFHTPEIDTELSKQSSTAQKYFLNRKINEVTPILNSFIDQLGYGVFNETNQHFVKQGTINDEYGIPWEMGKFWDKEQ